MKSWKKVALGGASVLALATLAACGSSASSNKSSSSSSSNNVKGNVTLWVDPANVDSYKTLVTGFEKKYPDVKVKVNLQQVLQMPKLTLVKTQQKQRMSSKFLMTNLVPWLKQVTLTLFLLMQQNG